MIGSLRAKALTAVLAIAAVVLGLAAFAPVTSAAAATTGGVTVANPTVAVGDTLAVDFSAPAAQVSVTNWIQVQLNGTTADTACHNGSTYWDYTSTDGTAEPASGTAALASGTLDFDTTGWATGSYAVYLCYNDGYTLIGAPVAVTVVPVQPVTVITSGHGTASSSPASPTQGQQVTLSETPAAGYSFAGWQLASPSDGSVTIADDGTFAMPAARVVVDADFEPIDYTVHFDGNGADGGSMADEAVSYDQAADLTANAFTRTGYVFAGWASAPSGTASYADGASVSDLTTTAQASVTLYAVWHAASSTVAIPSPQVLDVDFASGAPVDHAQGLAATTVGAPTVAPDAALGENVATFDGTSSAYQYDFTAQYSKLAQSFSVECRFQWNGAALSTLSASAFPSICSGEQNGGTNIEVYQNKLNASMLIGSTYYYAYAPAGAVVPGQWYDAVSTFDGSNLDFYLNGQLVASTPASGSLTVPPAASEKWTLGGDVNSKGGVEAESPVSLADSRIWTTRLSAAQVAAEYASSQANPVTITTSGQGTATASPSTAGAGVTVALSETPATGYGFGGWQIVEPSDGSVGIGSDHTFTMPASPTTIAADFVPNGYTVHFDGNGADGGSMADEPFSYDRAAALTGNGFTKDGYDFAGWASAVGAAPSYADGATVSNLTSDDQATVTLYAIWVPQGESLVEVTSAGHGTASGDEWAAAPGDTVTLSETADTGYHFAGWQVTQPTDGSVTIAADGAFTMPGEAVAVTASFAANAYTVDFDGNGADSGSMGPLAFDYDQTRVLPSSAFDRDGYTFTGWSTTVGGAVVYQDGASVSNLSATDGATVTLYAQWAPTQLTPGSWPSLPAGFVTDTLKLPGIVAGSAVQQQLTGLWNGTGPTSFTKVSGDAWLSVDAHGIVTGTAPSSAAPSGGAITVSATNGTTTAQLLVEIPVDAVSAAPQLHAATWNAWGDGSQVTDAVGKNLAVIAARGLGVIGFQDGGAQMAQQVAAALGWNVRQSGGLGIVSAYPFASDTVVAPTDAAPALAATVDVDGSDVRVWDAYLDESATDTTARATQAQAIADELQPDVNSTTTPVVLLGDLGSADLAPTFAATGLLDSYRASNIDVSTEPGVTWPVFPADAATASRIDYVDYTTAGDLTPLSSDTVSVGWPSATDVADNSWASDHAAVETVFSLGAPSTAPVSDAPTVTVGNGTIAYQVNAGPASPAVFLADVDASSDADHATLSADLSAIDFTTPGWYTAMVTAADSDGVSDPYAVAVRVAPVPGLTLGSTTATFAFGAAVDEAGVLAQLEPALDVDGATRVDLSQVDASSAGSYPITVTPSDDWGFTGPAQAATVVVEAAPAYTVAFDANGGAGTMASLAEPLTASAATLPVNAFTRTGYAFAGWASSAGGAVAYQDGATVDPLSTTDGGTVTLYAVWTPVSYTVSYDLAGGTATGANPTAYTVTDGFTLANPTRAGYTFAGWTGTGIAGTATAVAVAAGTTGALNYTATWTLIEYPITYQLAGGTTLTPDPTSYSIQSPDFTLVNPTRSGYTFAGWTGTGLPDASRTVTIAGGSTGARSYTATWTVVVTPPPPAQPKLAAVRAVAIPGSVRVGQLIAATPATWQKGARPAVSYQWMRDGKAVAGATGDAYTTTPSDRGHKLSVVESAVERGYQPGASTSKSVTVIAGVLATARPAITGTVQVGKQVAVAMGGWSPRPTTLRYQWYAGGKAIAGASAPRYTIGAAYAGASLTVKATGSAVGYTTASVTSAGRTVARGVFGRGTAQPRITGTVKVGRTVTAAHGSWTPSPSAFAYRWFANGTAVRGATKSTLKIPASLVGRRLTVQVTVSGTGYTPATVSSRAVTVGHGSLSHSRQKAGISGRAKVGGTLTASVGTWRPALVKLSYRWFANGKAITGATKKSYHVARAEAGKKLTVHVTGRESGYATLTIGSASVKIAAQSTARHRSAR